MGDNHPKGPRAIQAEGTHEVPTLLFLGMTGILDGVLLGLTGNHGADSPCHSLGFIGRFTLGCITHGQVTHADRVRGAPDCIGLAEFPPLEVRPDDRALAIQECHVGRQGIQDSVSEVLQEGLFLFLGLQELALQPIYLFQQIFLPGGTLHFESSPLLELAHDRRHVDGPGPLCWRIAKNRQIGNVFSCL